jgi:hypothetical protein
VAICAFTHQYDWANLMHPKYDFATVAPCAKSAQQKRFWDCHPECYRAQSAFQRNARTNTALINWFGRTAPIDAL